MLIIGFIKNESKRGTALWKNSIRQLRKPSVQPEEIYNEICDEIEDKEPGAYVFMSKKTDDTFFEYKIQIFQDQFNLSSIDIHTPHQVYHADFD